MSEFTCQYGHDMKPSDGRYCKECEAEGRRFEPVVRMDGMNNRELAAKDDWHRITEEE